MADQAEKSIDETPISPIERRNSLEKHLQTRPDAKDLKDRNILLDTTAAPCVTLGTSDVTVTDLVLLDHSNPKHKSWSASVLLIA